MNKDYIMERVGADSWYQVINAFSGKSRGETIDELNDMFPTEENDELADAIIKELSK